MSSSSPTPLGPSAEQSWAHAAEDGRIASVGERIRPRTGREPAPLSFAQERLWFLDQLQPGSPLYTIPTILPLNGPLDVEALGRALNDVVARHEALRTCFVLDGGRPMQCVAPAVEVDLPVVDCSHVAEDERLSYAQGVAAAEVLRPFNPSRGPLLRAVLYRLAPDDHWLLITIHHIVCDAWSVGIINHELATCYNARLTGRDPPLPTPPIQYGDYAAWQRQWLTGPVLRRLLGYWKDQLAGAPAVLELPTDRPRSPLQTTRGAVHAFTLPAELNRKLKAVASKERATLFIAAIAAFQALLARHTGQNDIVIGTPVANRSRSEVEGVVGLFLNTLVLRSRLADDPSFRRLVQRARDASLGALAHQDLPFEYLVEELQPDRRLSVNPLFQVFFVLQTADDPAGAAAAGANRGESYGHGFEVTTGTAKFDLSLYLTDTGGELRGAWEYNTDLFDALTLERMSGHLRVLLEAAVDNPELRVSELPLLTLDEWRQLRAWNETAVGDPFDACPHQLFEAQAATAPEATAIVCEGRQVSYGELNRRANQLAHHLNALGVGPEVPVGICVERSVEMIVGLLGILKAGGVHVPLDPAFPKRRLEFMVADAGLPLVLTQAHLSERLPVTGARLLRLDGDWQEIAQASEAAFESGVQPDNLVYMLYTSGSTGTPKGAGLRQATLTSLIRWQNRLAPTGPGARTLQFMSFSFDVSFIEILSTLAAGGTLVLLLEEQRRDAALLAQLLSQQRVERAFLPFTALQQLAQHVVSQDGPDLFLKHVVSTGEALVITQDIAALFRRLPDCRLHNEYGPTETHWVTASTLPEDQALAPWPDLPPIGRPVDNAEIHILDRNMRPVPVGVPGELYAGGLCLARGYHKRPAMTAERFVPNPFFDAPGARLYKTGDLARYRPDGTIEYLGRLDLQVKVRGFRVELGEIEVALGAHPAVRETAVAARTVAGGDKRLVAYLVPKGGSSIDIGSIRRFLSERLPDHMVPGLFVILDRIPLGATGKIDRMSLPDPELSRPNLEQKYLMPRNPLEAEVVAIWATVLGLKKIGINDDFFQLGGHSLLATQVISRVRQTFNVSLPLRQIFERPTVAELAQAILQKQVEGLDESELAALLADIEGLSENEVLAALGCREESL